MQDTINSLLEYGYILLFIYSLGGGMVGILAAGVLSSNSDFNILTCIILAFLANTIGSILLFIIGKYYKKDLRIYLKKHRRKLALAQLKIKKHGIILIFIQKFIYGLKTFIPLAAGFAKYDFTKFIIINTLASLIWAIVLGYGGFVFGSLIVSVFDELSNYSYIVPLFLLLLICIIWFYLAKFSKK